MRTASWGDLMLDDSQMSGLPVERLEAIARAAECYSTTLNLGIAAVGELLAYTSSEGELAQDTAMSVGWLIDLLCTLNVRISGAERAAEYQLRSKTALNLDS